MAAERLTVTLALTVPYNLQASSRDAVQKAIERALLPFSENGSAIYLMGASFRLGQEAGPESIRYNATVAPPTVRSAVPAEPSGTTSEPSSSSA